MKLSRALFAGLVALISTTHAARVQPADLGLSVWVPPGWLLSNEGGDSTFRLYTLYDTTGNHAALFQLEANSGATAGGGADQWVRDEALVRGYLIEGSCYGNLLSDDSATLNGHYTREVYGRAATCDSGSTTLLSDLQDRFYRIMATGDIGWVMSFEGDTTDVDSAAGTYLSILDSIQLDPSFQTIPPVGIKAFHNRARSGHRISTDPKGLMMDLQTDQRPEIQVMDLNGRVLSGLVSSRGGGLWAWRPDASHQGMVVVRVRSGSSQWMDRAVLPR
jgi:hypothetical protein